MRKYFHSLIHSTIITALCCTAFTSCNEYNAVLKSTDAEYKYEAAKSYYMAGQYVRAYQLLEELVVPLKATDMAEESLYMLGMCHYNTRDYETASLYLDRYVSTYPKGEYTELARLYSAKSQYRESPDPRLDQTPTYKGINQLQDFLEFHPYSKYREEVTNMIFELQDRLVQKEFDSAKLYYNLGSYMGNCANGGSNYTACIITAENALKSYPYTHLREELYMMILRARFQLASISVVEKEEERFRETIDEYYGFKNEFPESKYIKEADNIFKRANRRISKTTELSSAN